MIDNSELDGVEYTSEGLPVDEVVETRRPAKTRRLIGLVLLVLLLIVGAVAFIPGLRNDILPQARRARKARAAKVAEVPPPPVPVVWDQIDLAAMSDSVAEDLKLGKYYYDRRQPGNFGLAIDQWKQAMAHPGGDREELRTLVKSAELELARQFSTDSADAFVLLKQGRRDDAVRLLQRMRANYLDIKSPQYVWASQMLARRRR